MFKVKWYILQLKTSSIEAKLLMFFSLSMAVFFQKYMEKMM